MRTRPLLHRSLVLVVLLALLLASSPLPTLAQDGSTFLPIVAGGGTTTGGVTGPVGLFRTHVEVATPAAWATLERLGVRVLQQGEAWAVVLADDAQLEELARWRYNPTDTNALATLAAASSDPIATSFAPLVAHLAGVQAADVASVDAARIDVRAAMLTLAAEQMSWLAAAAGVDTDGDGLSDDAEGWWCTGANIDDSDGDGTLDGEEVTRLKQWMNNKTARHPDSGRPAVDWPPLLSMCYDTDKDGVPDRAESYELGLSPSRESTDRDKFDDGQELFGTTHCPGSGLGCGWGSLPRNDDWGIFFAEMPSWVKAPGHHPLVAGFPVPEIDVLDSSLYVERVTTITTEQGTMTEQTHSYSTAKTEGNSTSVADTETWNSWQEITESVEKRVLGATALPTSFTEAESTVPQRFMVGAFATSAEQRAYGDYQSGCRLTSDENGSASTVDVGVDAGLSAHVGGEINRSRGQTELEAIAVYECEQTLREIIAEYPSTSAVYQPVLEALANTHQDTTVENNNHNYNNNIVNVDLSAVNKGLQGVQLAFSQSGTLLASRLSALTNVLLAPTVTRSEANGSSRGGSHTVEHTAYEETTITNGEAFTTGEDWRTATAADSSHAANLWFSYVVRNGGTEYARAICNLTFNIYIGETSVPSYTYFVPEDRAGACFESFDPGEQHVFTAKTNTHAIPLTLEELRTIDTGGTIRIVVEDFTFGLDERFYKDATDAGIMFALEDGTLDGDETIDPFLIPTWGAESVLQVLARYFPHETDLDGNLTAIWTPEFNIPSGIPAWCSAGWRPTDQPSKALWCKHQLSTADWWNVYTDGLGDGSEGFQDTQAVPGATALFRFNSDRDLDGFSDRSEARLGSDPADAGSFPHPELLGGLHSVQVGSQVTATLSLLNTGLYDAYGVEAVMIAPDDSISIANNTVGGSGRVRALKDVIVGSRILLQQPLPAPWTQANHAVPAAAGYYTGSADRTYSFVVSCATAGGCRAGEGAWTLNWSDGKGATGSLAMGAGYASPTFQSVGAFGLTLALYSGTVLANEAFTVAANTPRDTFQYSVNRTPHAEPIVIVSYNDPQGNHRFVLPPQAMALTAPTENLQQFAGQMLPDVGVEIVTQQPAQAGANAFRLLVNNPAAQTLTGARLFVESINLTGTVVSEVALDATLPPGPTWLNAALNTASFAPPYVPADDYIVMAFLTDWQGNILDTAGRPLSSFQPDPLPALSGAAPTLNLGSVAQGTLVRFGLPLANTGQGALYTWLTPAPGIVLSKNADTVGAADLPDFDLLVRTAELPLGALDRTLTLKTSDPARPTVPIRLVGTITAGTPDATGGTLHPLDANVSVPGPLNQGDWYTFNHTFGPNPETLHPVKLFAAGATTLLGVGKYATDFAAGTASYEMFGDGRDGVMPASGNLDSANGAALGIVNSGSAGATSISVTDAWGIARVNPGDAVLIHQTQGTGAGCWEINKAVTDFTGGTQTVTLAKPLNCNYISDSGSSHAQIQRVPQYSTCNVTGTVTPLYGWNGSYGGVVAVMCKDGMTLSGEISVSGSGYRGGTHKSVPGSRNGQGEGYPRGPNIETSAANGNGGGGGRQESGDQRLDYGGGGGGGHASAGGNAQYQGAVGGSAVGDPTLATLFMGGGGGVGGGPWDELGLAGTGGSGGGIVLVYARTFSVSGMVRANGGAGQVRAGGGGAGGTVYITGYSVNAASGRIEANGGFAGATGGDTGYGGNGAMGRVKLSYCQTFTGSTSPTAFTQKLTCYVVEQVESAPWTQGRLNLPAAVAGGATANYTVQYARRVTYGAGGSQAATLRVPAGLLASATLDALVSGLPADATFALDIGSDGSVEWSGTVANNSTNASPDVASAFNAWWTTHGAPTTGTLDVPVTLSLNQPGQLLLSNLVVTTAGAKTRTLRLEAGTYSSVSLTALIGGSGAGHTTLGVDVGADGTLDWNGASTSPRPFQYTISGLATAVNAWLAGKSGLVDIPIRIFVAPDAPLTLLNASAVRQPTLDLAAAGLTLGAAQAAAAGVDASSYNEGATVPLQVTLQNPSSTASGPVTVAFFATVTGWGDWYLGSVFVPVLPAQGSVPASLLWNSEGFSGATQIKAVVNPYGRTGETGFANNTTTTPITILPRYPSPTVNFTATPVLGGAPLQVHFTSQLAGTVETLLWRFGDGETSSEPNPTHTYTQTGDYTVSLEVGGRGGSAFARKVAFVQVTTTPLAPTAAFTLDTASGNAPLAVQFSDQSVGTITGRVWSFGDGTPNSTQTSPQHTFANAGTFSVTLTVSGPGGSDGETKQVVVNTPPLKPQASFVVDRTGGAAPLLIRFTDTSGGGPVTAWLWTFGDGSSSSEQHPAHTFQTAGDFTVTLTVTGPGGQDASTLPISVIDSIVAAPRAHIATNTANGVAPLAVQFTGSATDGPVTAWLWTFGDGSTSVEQSPVHTFESAGVFTVRLRVSGPGGAHETTAQITVTNSGGQPEADFHIYLPQVRGK